MRKKKTNDTSLKVQYQRLKCESRKATVEACEHWWETKAEEAEKLPVQYRPDARYKANAF